MNAIIPAATLGITTREQFHAALALINQQVRRPGISIDEAKDTMTKAEALRAWAKFDRRLTDDEKKEANRAMTRTIHMLAELADKEQPAAARGEPGPVNWLQRELGVLKSRAVAMRSLITHPEFYRVALDSGVHWATVVCSSFTNKARGTRVRGLSRALQFVNMNNSLKLALKVQRYAIPNELSRIRKIKAWCEAYEHALMQRRAKEPLRSGGLRDGKD